MSVHSYVSKHTRIQVSQNFLYMLPVAVARSSSDDGQCNVLWLTSGFPTMAPIGQNQRRRYASSSSPDVGTGDKVAVYECFVQEPQFHLLLPKTRPGFSNLDRPTPVNTGQRMGMLLSKRLQSP